MAINTSACCFFPVYDESRTNPPSTKASSQGLGKNQRQQSPQSSHDDPVGGFHYFRQPARCFDGIPAPPYSNGSRLRKGVDILSCWKLGLQRAPQCVLRGYVSDGIYL